MFPGPGDEVNLLISLLLVAGHNIAVIEEGMELVAGEEAAPNVALELIRVP